MNQPTPLLTVVVPVFNGADHLPSALRSIALLEERLPCQVIVQNALSSDQSGAIADEFCEGKPFWRHVCEPDDGQSDAINRGMRLATAPWATWLCADDVLLPGLVDALQAAERDNADLVYGNVIFDYQDRLVPAINVETHTPGGLARRHLILEQRGTCIRREAWEQAGGVRQDLFWTMDYDLFLRLERMNLRFYRDHRFVALARIHPEAKTSSGSAKRLRELWSVFRANHRRCPRHLRLHPYLLYTLEYLIKSLEARPASRGAALRPHLLAGLHSMFWLMAHPGEEKDIRRRFTQDLPSLTPQLHALNTTLPTPPQTQQTP